MALVLLAMLLTLAVTSIRTAVQASRSGEALIARTEQARTVQGFLRRQLSQAMPIAYEQAEVAGEVLRFEADDQGLRFVSLMPGYLSRGGAHLQSLEFVSGNGGQRLQFNHAQLNGYDNEEPVMSGDPVVLLDGIAGGRFEFRDIDDRGELGDWISEWDTPERLPLMVRLEIDFKRDDPRHWPAFEVTLMAAASGLQPIGLNQIRPSARVRGTAPRPVNPGDGR